MERLNEQINFIIEIDKLKGILRQSLILNGERRENDAEHSWHMSMAAVILREYFDKDIDMVKVFKMILIHDIVEILTGDTPAYGSFSPSEKHEKEKESANITFGILPKDQKEDLIKIWNEFEDMETDEAKFANACDRFQGFIQNVTSDAFTWRKFKPSKSTILKRMRPVIEYMPKVYDGFIKGYLQKYIDLGIIEDDKTIKMVASDLDGTFINNKKEVTDLNLKVINKLIDKGLEFVVASGRDYTSIKDITRDISKINYYICLNGAKIYKDNEIIYKKSVAKDISYDILKKSVELNIKYSGTTEKEICYSQLDTEYYKEFALENKNFIFTFNEDGKSIEARDFEKIVFYGEVEELTILRNYIEEKYFDKVNVFLSGNRIMDVVNKEANKGNALKIIAFDMGIGLDEVIAFGDNENDLAMLEEVAYPVVVENARDIVKEKIKDHTLSNEKDGVGKYLIKIFNL